MYEDLSNKQLEVLMFLKRFIQGRGYPPSVREICSALDLKSTSSAYSLLEKLEKFGYIKRAQDKPRAIEIIENTEYDLPSRRTVDLPVVGTVTAGIPVLAVENIMETFPMPVDIVKDRQLFLIRVNGDSMIDVGIYGGDYALVEKRDTADNGDIVLALIDQEFSTIKTFYKEKDHIRLQPQNPSMTPIISRNVKILGKVVGVMRFFK